MLLEIHPYSPQSRHVDSLVKILTSNGVIIFPIDTAYVFCCALSSKKAMKRIYQLKNGDKKTHLTFVCNKTKQFQEYTTGLSNQVFRKIKSSIPGPYIFVFEASKKIPKTLLSSRPIIGVKIPESPLSHLLVEQMDEPLLTSSIPKEMAEQDFQDGYTLHEQYEKLVDCVVDSGELYLTKSAIIDFTHSPPKVIRTGDVDVSWL
jgi:tRNA threonylcarbamoyl adenosine modification protein (Sua5/YciO/YrdC/YwlC family)